MRFLIHIVILFKLNLEFARINILVHIVSCFEVIFLKRSWTNNIFFVVNNSSEVVPEATARYKYIFHANLRNTAQSLFSGPSVDLVLTSQSTIFWRLSVRDAFICYIQLCEHQSPPDSSLRHATGGGYAGKWRYCHSSVPSASLSPDPPPPPPAATCCRHPAATMGCHLIMNHEGTGHWFKVPLLLQSGETAGMMTERRLFVGFEHRWCFFFFSTRSPVVSKLCSNCWTILVKVSVFLFFFTPSLHLVFRKRWVISEEKKRKN